jgi:phosphatidate cytidylyltransferase
MLKHRFFTALLLIPLVVALLLGPWMTAYQLFVSLVVLLAVKEWAVLLGFNLLQSVGLGFLSLGTAFFLLEQSALSEVALVKGALCAMALWCVAFIEIAFYPKKILFSNKYLALIYGFLLLSVFGYLLLAIKILQPYALLLLQVMILTWASDTGAYFVGKRFGKKKMAPSISPNKTIAGFLGGGLLASVGGLLFFVLGTTPLNSVFSTLIFAFSIHVVAVLGDLFESVLKRHCKVKDSGKLLPGHGGVLDRLDSLIATIPAAVVLIFALIKF